MLKGCYLYRLTVVDVTSAIFTHEKNVTDFKICSVLFVKVVAHSFIYVWNNFCVAILKCLDMQRHVRQTYFQFYVDTLLQWLVQVNALFL